MNSASRMSAAYLAVNRDEQCATCGAHPSERVIQSATENTPCPACGTQRFALTPKGPR